MLSLSSARPLILVLGHNKCGAVDAAVKAVKDGKAFSGHIPSLIEAIRPAVKIAQNQQRHKRERPIQRSKIENNKPDAERRSARRKIESCWGLYSLDTGRVTLIA
jgi:carbonic anhydrase